MATYYNPVLEDLGYTDSGIGTLAAGTTSTPSPTTNSLRDQILQQWGAYGEWDASGVDRAQELADLLAKAGVTTLGDLSVTKTPYSTEGAWTTADVSDSGPAWIPGTSGDKWDVSLGDTKLGFLGDYNNDNTYGSKADYGGGFTSTSSDQNPLVAWSARGKGGVGYHLVQDPQTGKWVIAPSWGSTSDADRIRQNIWGSLAVTTPFIAPIVAPYLGAAAPAATGAVQGASTAGMSGGDTQDILKGAIIGGIGGYLGGEAYDYINSGDVGSGAGFPGEGAPSGIPEWDQAAYNAGVPLDQIDPYGPGSNWGQDTISNTTPTTDITTPSSSGTPSSPGMPSASDSGDVVEIVDSRLPPADTSSGIPSLAVPPYVPPITSTNPTPSTETGTSDTTKPPDKPFDFFDWLKANPKLGLQALGLFGSLFNKGGGGSGGSPDGIGGLNSQAGMTATQAPAFQRQYIAPPPGYRPGFDPEHNYFTGIGTVGTGS